MEWQKCFIIQSLVVVYWYGSLWSPQCAPKDHTSSFRSAESVWSRMSTQLSQEEAGWLGSVASQQAPHFHRRHQLMYYDAYTTEHPSKKDAKCKWWQYVFLVTERYSCLVKVFKKGWICNNISKFLYTIEKKAFVFLRGFQERRNMFIVASTGLFLLMMLIHANIHLEKSECILKWDPKTDDKSFNVFSNLRLL